MQVISVPQGLKAAVSALVLCLPLSAMQIVLMRNAPWWRLPWTQIALATAPALVIGVVLAWLLLRGRPIGYRAVVAAAICWFGSTAWTAIRLQNVSLGFFAIFLGAVLLVFVVWLRNELQRSFYDPRVRWFEGLPKPIPGVACEMFSDSKRILFRVSRLDREGTFLYREETEEMIPEECIKAGITRNLSLTFRDRTVHCIGVPIRALHRPGPVAGIGFKFHEMSPDACKALGDFVETLKGEGYVQ